MKMSSLFITVSLVSVAVLSSCEPAPQRQTEAYPDSALNRMPADSQRARLSDEKPVGEFKMNRKITEVKAMYVLKFDADAGGFRRNLIDALNLWGRIKVLESDSDYVGVASGNSQFSLAYDSKVDAIVRGSGNITKEGYLATIEILDARTGETIWQKYAKRDADNPRMAFEQIVTMLRADVARIDADSSNIKPPADPRQH